MSTSYVQIDGLQCGPDALRKGCDGKVDAPRCVQIDGQSCPKRKERNCHILVVDKERPNINSQLELTTEEANTLKAKHSATKARWLHMPKHTRPDELTRRKHLSATLHVRGHDQTRRSWYMSHHGLHRRHCGCSGRTMMMMNLFRA